MAEIVKQHISKRRIYFLLYTLLLFMLLLGIIAYGNYKYSASAAVGFDYATSLEDGSNETQWQHTVGNYANRMVIVGLSENIHTSSSGVRYNGQPMTKLSQWNCSSCTTSMWYVLNPPVGTGTVSVTTVSAFSAISLSLYNVDTANPFGSINTSIAFGRKLPAVTLNNTNETQFVINYIGMFGTTNPLRPTSGQVLVDEKNSNVDNKSGYHAYMAVTNANSPSTNLTWSEQDSGESINVGIAINGLANSAPTVAPTIQPTIVSTPTQQPATASPSPTSLTTPTLAIPGPSTTQAPSATPPASGNVGSINNLNFGINNAEPWMQVICGDIRMDNGIRNEQPANQRLIETNTSCNSPGIAFTGDGTAQLGNGEVSQTNTIVGGATYPEVYRNTSELMTSYTSLTKQAENSDLPKVNLSTVCTLSNCTLPNNLPSGIYFASNSLVLNNYTFPPNRDYLFLIDGAFTINGNLTTLPSDNTTVVFSAVNDIIVAPTVGNIVTDSTTTIAGVYSTDRSFVMQSANNCTDRRLVIAGTVIANAGRNGGQLLNNRDLCADNATTPVLQIQQRLDLVLNLPEYLRYYQIISREINP